MEHCWILKIKFINLDGCPQLRHACAYVTYTKAIIQSIHAIMLTNIKQGADGPIVGLQ